MKQVVPSIVFIGLVTWAATVNAKQPNILLVIADDYGWNDIGYHGSEINTPTLDKLASDGVKLENYYVQPICTPTRSQLMSGKYQIHTGLQHGIIWAEQPNCLPLDDPTLADKMKELGYSTHIVGKWHLGFYKKECTPTHRGFDSFFGYLTGSEDYFSHRRCYSPAENMESDKAACGTDLHDNEANDDGYKGQYSAQLFTEKAQKVVEKHAQETPDKPLFLYMPFQSVHSPMQVPEKYTKPYAHIQDRDRRIYAGMVAAMDEGIKNLTQTFKDQGLWDNTLLVFSTDNGGQILCGGNNWPLRGWKGSLWDGGMHGNGFVAGAGLSDRVLGTVSRGLVHVSDWYPTLVTLAGGNVTGMKLDGHDQWKTISEGEDSPRTELLHNIDPKTTLSGSRYPNSPFDNRVRAAIRVGDWKLITGNPGNSSWIPPPPLADNNVLRFVPRHDNHAPLPSTARELQTTNLIPNTDETSQNLWLFNIANDPNERNELSAEFPDKVMELLERLAYYNSTAVPVNYPPFDPNSNPALHGGFWEPWE